MAVWEVVVSGSDACCLAGPLLLSDCCLAVGVALVMGADTAGCVVAGAALG